MSTVLRGALGATLLALMTVASSAADKVTIGIVNAVSDGTLFIAQDKGYFQAEGVEARQRCLGCAHHPDQPYASGVPACPRPRL